MTIGVGRVVELQEDHGPDTSIQDGVNDNELNITQPLNRSEESSHSSNKSACAVNGTAYSAHGKFILLDTT